MSKRIIAAIAVVTIVFVSVFAACSKDDGVYSKNDDLNLVTDENGEKILDDSGKLLVYVTDEDGDRVTDANGEYETMVHQFRPFEENGIVEDYGFKIALPEGWKTTDQFGVFENSSKSQKAEISVVESAFADYYEYNKAFYEKLNEYEATWEDGIQLGDGFNNAYRFTLKTEDSFVILYSFENTNNTYKVLFNATDVTTAIADSEAFCKAMTFKPYTYYPDVTSASTDAASVPTTVTAQ